MGVKIETETPRTKRAVVVPETRNGEPVLHFVSNSRQPLKVKNHDTGEVRTVRYGEYLPEASTWKPNIQHANVRMEIIRQVDAPPPSYRPPVKASAPIAEKKSHKKPEDEDPIFAGASGKGP